MKKYRVVRKAQDLRFIVEAIQASGGEVLAGPSPDAPFEIKVLSPSGEILDLVCYAFHANKYRQKGRPDDEHRFQIKYGSQFDRYHDIFIGDSRSTVTLFFGVHREREVFVASDPAMHNPTWFSKSVEFKDHHLDGIRENGGWAGWERERSAGRRKQQAPLLNCQTEVLLGFEPQRFFDYVELERVATGLAPGLRLLLIERFSHSPFERNLQHPLAQELGLTEGKIFDLIVSTNRLNVAVRGSAAEEHLRIHLASVRGIEDVVRLDKDGKPDFQIRYRGSSLLIECKNVLRRLSRGRVKVDFQKTRASPRDPCTRYYSQGDFDILAACLFPVTEAWTFRFRATRSMTPHPKCARKLSQHVFVDEAGWSDSVGPLLAELPSRD